VLLDTCVFIDNGHDALPQGARRLLAASGLTHLSSVTAMELAYAFGRLDPNDPRTGVSLRHLREVLDRAPGHRVVTASPADHTLAGVLAGTLTRTQGLNNEARRRLLFDCLIFASARRNGLTVLTANHRDFDLLLQLLPDGKAAFYQARTGRQNR
jgi:predicted nucleic acid-binding protein